MIDTTLKLRVVFSFLSIRRSLLKDYEKQIRHVLDLASRDDDEWLRLASDMLRFIFEDNGQDRLQLQNDHYKAILEPLQALRMFSLRMSVLQQQGQ